MPARSSMVHDVPVDVLREMVRNPKSFDKRIEEFVKREKAARQAEADSENEWGKIKSERADLALSLESLKRSQGEFAERMRREDSRVAQVHEDLRKREKVLERRKADFDLLESELKNMETGLKNQRAELSNRFDDLDSAGQKMDAQKEALDALADELNAREKALNEYARQLRAVPAP